MSDIYSGHRSRLKKKFLNWPDSLETHELLELLLFYSIPRCDTKKTAHELLNRFENLQGVLNADVDDLCNVEGVGESSATLIKICATLASRYGLEQIDTRLSLPSFSTLCEYLKHLYVGTSNEKVYLILLNNSLKILKTQLIHSGNVNLSSLQIRSMIETALKYKASYAILVHNHPNGSAIPSGADIEATHLVNQAFSLISVNFVDHVIYADGKATPVMHGNSDSPEASFDKTLKQIRQ